ncbi:hypothetical protein [Kutzneria sp. CA-103260]|uniref:hypothetical protein n=1 Tax=Kutzneria sp. CA-103260 TaxID=2802641 RepID=UPI001BAB9D41|nr:hypothetical protein [Kutzneria sp. CA-103260]QUQ63184.1 hypothetical protein JJ691_08960 [Kutzneria sp. CA-103260]
MLLWSKVSPPPAFGSSVTDGLADVVGVSVVVVGGVVVVVVVVATGTVVVTAGGVVVVTTGGVVVVVVGGGVVTVVVLTVTVNRVNPFWSPQVALMAYVPGFASAGAVARTLPCVPGDPLARGAPAQVKVITRHCEKPPQRMVNWLPAGPLVGVTDTAGAVAADATAGSTTPTQSARNVTVRTSIRIAPSTVVRSAHPTAGRR